MKSEEYNASPERGKVEAGSPAVKLLGSRDPNPAIIQTPLTGGFCPVFPDLEILVRPLVLARTNLRGY